MTQSFINPLSKFTSDTLKTLPYSRLYFFENESSTPKEIFKDKAKTISWGVYAESDSAGNFPPIWFDGVCRATLKWSPNWLTSPAGVVQTGWPIDNIGTDQSFDADVIVNGDLTADNLYSLGIVQSKGNAGFRSDAYTLNARNPIWSFSNATGYGISYFAGNAGIGIDDKIGLHFGTATLIASEFTFDDDGNFNAIGKITSTELEVTNIEVNGNAIFNSYLDVAGNFTTDGNSTFNGPVSVGANFSVDGSISTDTTVTADQGVRPGNTLQASPITLDWYEEGTFTPVAIGSTTPGTGTYAGFAQSGYFTRIGNRVFFSIGIGWSAHTGTGDLRISGLPYAASSVGASDGESCLSFAYYGLLVAAGKELSGTVINGLTQIQLSASDPAGSGSFTAVAMDTTVGNLKISGSYRV